MMLPIAIAGPTLLKSLAAFLLAVLPVAAKNNAGKVYEGELDGFTQTSLQLNVSGEIVELPFDDLLLLSPQDAEERTGPTHARVTLVGGSMIAAQDLSYSDGVLVIEPRRQNPLRVSIKEVKAIRFRPSSVATDAQWLGIIDRDNRGDTLVIRRPGDRLDPQQGMVVSMDNGKVAFDLDGDVVNAPIDRLEGVVFGGTPSVREDADIRVTDIYGSKWALISIEPSKGDQPLQMRLSPAVLHPLPLHQIESIRFSGGFTMLADEKPASTSFQAYLQTDVNQKLVSDFFGPTREGESDLLMFGGSSIEYRIDGSYQTLAGTVRRHPDVTRAGLVTVRIELDGKTVWEQELSDGNPRGFEVPLERARRVTMTVDSAGDGDLGDTVRISRPRLLK